MHRNQLVMQSDSDFVRWVGFMFDPVTHIVERLAQRNLDQMRLDTEVAFGLSILPRPAPDALEHATMQTLKEAVAGGDVTPTRCPPISGRDILLLKLV